MRCLQSGLPVHPDNSSAGAGRHDCRWPDPDRCARALAIEAPITEGALPPGASWPAWRSNTLPPLHGTDSSITTIVPGWLQYCGRGRRELAILLVDAGPFEGTGLPHRGYAGVHQI
jgi:hypothetical protein